MLKKIVAICIWVFVIELISYFLGNAVQGDINTWYLSLEKSSLTPPAIVFPLVWSVLYLMIALSGWWLWEHRNHSSAKMCLLFFSIQMLLNWSWSPLFFYFHFIGMSVICILLLSFFTLITILKTRHQFKLSSIMLMPYFLWLLFASYLNIVIWILN